MNWEQRYTKESARGSESMTKAPCPNCVLGKTNKITWMNKGGTLVSTCCNSTGAISTTVNPQERRQLFPGGGSRPEIATLLQQWRQKATSLRDAELARRQDKGNVE